MKTETALTLDSWINTQLQKETELRQQGEKLIAQGMDLVQQANAVREALKRQLLSAADALSGVAVPPTPVETPETTTDNVLRGSWGRSPARETVINVAKEFGREFTAEELAQAMTKALGHTVRVDNAEQTSRRVESDLKEGKRD